ncbi:alpha/beta hydrolase [Synechococcus sp. BS55D]|uniref:alpha/beta hydrolase n=1 Tax=Synechococcus sp. BS55D TaxID=2055943 RepID=UPI00103B0306|nr:alpha/beta fold hydrolase [Synechococcus sp. BS55D]TCD58432.1 esterase [Synechococcus sp. BS55D]
MPAANPSDRLLLNPPGAQRRLVLLHGWGADADDLLPLGQALTADLPQPVELIALRAPEPHPQGSGRQWYGLFPSDWQAVPSAQAALCHRLKELESGGIPLAQTVLLGFSQGAAMAVLSGCDLPLAGVISCSGYPHPGWEAPANRPSVLLLHGKNDEIVPFEASLQLQSLLNANTNAAKADLVASESGHTIDSAALPAIAKALRAWWS